MSTSTLFSELEIGAEFDLNIDADGREPLFYKLNALEAYQFEGSHAGQREAFVPQAHVWPTGAIRPISGVTVTEIERAACTLIGKQRAQHPALTAWKQAIVGDLGEMRYLHTFVWENRETLRPMCEQYGFAFPESEYDNNVHLFGLIWEHEPAGKYTDSDSPVNASYREAGGEWDAPLLALCQAVVAYRIAGRPAGDQSHTIEGMGAPLLRVTTSLAAAVVEYHVRIKNQIYLDHQGE